MMDSYKTSAQKPSFGVIEHQNKIGAPSKYSYITGDSAPRLK